MTATPSLTPPPERTATPSHTPTRQLTATPTAESTRTSTIPKTSTPTKTFTPTRTFTATKTPTTTPTGTPLPNLNLTVTNALSGQPIAGLEVSIYRRTSETTTAWVAKATTDGGGRVAFLLGDLGTGAVFFASAKPYGVTTTTPDITAPADIPFAIGSLEVLLVSGATNEALAGISASAREVLADGSLRTQTTAKADPSGVIRLDLPGLGSGRTYLIETKSAIDGSTKRSQPFATTGRHTFVVGNAPLEVTLVNAITEAPVAAERVTVRERLADGSLRWVNARDTDDQGRTVFDVDGLGTGRIFVLSSKPYDTTTAYSAPIAQPGAVVFPVGSVEVKVVDGIDGQPLPGWWITVKERLANGNLKWVADGGTDDAGVIRFDFEGLGAGRTFVLQASSPIDGSTKQSEPITAPGVHVFAVGNKPLVVTLRDALSDDIIAGEYVSVYEPVGADDWQWVNGGETDADGHVIFDLDGLGDAATGEGQTRSYVLVCEPFNGGWAESDPITRAGTYEFRVGNLEVQVLSGATGEPLRNTDVSAYEVVGEDDWRWHTWGQTDEAGMIRFDLPGLGRGRQYVLQANSPIDNSQKRTDILVEPGHITFVVGNKPLFVTMVNGVSGLPVADTDVTVYEILPNGEWEWTTWGLTDANGFVPFDLDGLGDGRVYFLHTCPYDIPVHSDPLAQPGAVLFRVGTVPLRLVDGDNNTVIPGAGVTLWEKLPNGELRWAAWAETDANGMIRFDLEGVSRTTIFDGIDPAPTGRVYVFEVENPFDEECRDYFSPLIDTEGPLDFVIRRGESYPLDLVPPEIGITRPVSGGRVDVAGFVVTGVAGDDVRIDSVSVSVADPVAGTTTGTAAYDAATQQWSFTVTPQMVTEGRTITVIARATDQARNRAEATVSVQVVADTAAPQISVTSHADGAEVEKTGFLLSGVATDDIGVTSLTATVTDPLLGATIAGRNVDVDPDSGSWTLAVLNGQISEGQTVHILLTAADRRGHVTNASLDLHVVGVDFEGYHLISRLTFGATPALRAEVASIGPDAFVTQQLAPASIDDSAFDATIAARPAPANTADLQVYELLHAINSRRQLREVLTAFWDNHFNTDINKSKVVAYELAENNAFRQAALGNFRTLLGISAKSPAMLVYLDNAMSVRGAPNENYARELMELHTLSVDGGYTQRDVEQVARAFTGWQVTNGQFAFSAANHDTGVKTVLGRTLAAGRGIEDGEEVLDILASHPSTARFICEKLSQLFVSDTPPAGLVSRCASTFLSSGGAITATVQTILRSPEFADPIYFRAKVKTPVEFIVGVVRNLQASTTAYDLISPMRDMGMRLFENPVPTGWSETGDDWLNSNLLIQRIQYVHTVAGATPGNGTSVQLRTFFTNAGYTTADGIVGFLFHLLFHNDYTATDREVAMNILTNGGTQTFDIAAPQAETRLRRLVATVMSYPGYEFQ